jgi:hypothetical protein
MPDTLYAKLRQQPPTRPIGYAMIFSCLGSRGTLLSALREAGRSNLMIPSDRSTSTLRAIAFLLVSLGIPQLAFPANLEDSAKELARKVAANVSTQQIPGPPPRNDISVEIRNLSSLSAMEFDQVRQVFLTELQLSGVAAGDPSGVPPKALVTLSESLDRYVWSAEIQLGGVSHVVITSSPRPTENRVVTDAMSITLHSEKFWEGSDRIFDVNFDFLSNLEQRMVLLVRDGLIVTTPQKNADSTKVEFSPAKNVGRNPLASLNQYGNKAVSDLDGQECEVDLDRLTLVRCFVPRGPVDVSIDKIQNSEQPNYGDETKTLLPNCGKRGTLLASGAGDYTQPDSLQIFDGAAPVSNTLNFPGPVLKLTQGQDTQFVTAIVRNLKDGNYELYRLSFSCGQ